MAIDKFKLQYLAVPAVVLLITFLAYGSQVFLFPYLEPRDLTASEKRTFNILLGCLWVCYWRAVVVNPGRVPANWTGGDDGRTDKNEKKEAASPHSGYEEKTAGNGEIESQGRLRWCRKCDCVKPPRAHHCKVCQRCIPRMDHHCPWTANCVSHFTLPHFMRFLFYATTSMVYLEKYLFVRVGVIWQNRGLPSYLGPTTTGFVLLFIYVLANSLTLFAVGIILLRSAYDMVCNTTTIEGWEISRHAQLLRRARALGGFLYGPDGQKVMIKKQEFPYDIGIWQNVSQAMGSSNPLAWFWPLSMTRRRDAQAGLVWETNGFEDRSIGWPPVDPDRIPRLRPWGQPGGAFTHDTGYGEATTQEQLIAFRNRQAADLTQRGFIAGTSESDSQVHRQRRFHDRFDQQTYQYIDGQAVSERGHDDDCESGEEGWKDDGGSRLNDYGVDEDIEFYDEDDVPLGQLIRRRKAVQERKAI